MRLDWLTAQLVDQLHFAIQQQVPVASTINGLRGATLSGLLEYGCLRHALPNLLPSLPQSLLASDLGQALLEVRSALGVRNSGSQKRPTRRLDRRGAEFFVLEPGGDVDDDCEQFFTRFDWSAQEAGFSATVAHAAEVERQVESGKLTLADVDALGTKGEDFTKGVVSIIFGTGNSQEVALAFLASERLDAEIVKKSAIKELAGLVTSTFEIDLPENATIPNIRERLARHILLTDLVNGLDNDVPSSLSSVKIAVSPGAVAACTSLAGMWRLRRDVRETYVAASQKVEADFQLANLDFDPKKIVGVETFLAVEQALLRHVEEALLAKANDDLVALRGRPRPLVRRRDR